MPTKAATDRPRRPRSGLRRPPHRVTLFGNGPVETELAMDTVATLTKLTPGRAVPSGLNSVEAMTLSSVSAKRLIVARRHLGPLGVELHICGHRGSGWWLVAGGPQDVTSVLRRVARIDAEAEAHTAS